MPISKYGGLAGRWFLSLFLLNKDSLLPPPTHPTRYALAGFAEAKRFKKAPPVDGGAFP